MKLDVVADVADRIVIEGSETKYRRLGVSLRWMLTAIVGSCAAFCMMSASSAIANDGIDLSEPDIVLEGIDLTKPAEAAAPGECPKLIQIKYPFISCESGVIGLADGNATWENSRQIPIGSDFVEGNGYWGDDLNQK
jgi:hypothetical protein